MKMQKKFLFTLVPLLSIPLVGCSKIWYSVDGKEAAKLATSIYAKCQAWSENNYPFTSFNAISKNDSKTIYNNSISCVDTNMTIDFDLNNHYKKENLITQKSENGSYHEQYVTKYWTYDKANKINYTNLNLSSKTGTKTLNVDEQAAKTAYMKLGSASYFLSNITNAYNRLNNFSSYCQTLETLHELYKNNDDYYFDYSFTSDKEGDLRIYIKCYMDQDITKYLNDAPVIDFIDNKLEYEVVFKNNLISNLSYTYECNSMVNKTKYYVSKSHNASYQFNKSIHQDKIDLSQFKFN